MPQTHALVGELAHYGSEPFICIGLLVGHPYVTP